MKVAVLGLGYVGCVSAACIAHRGHDVVGVDTNPRKVEFVSSGRTPVLEPGLDELIARETSAGRLTATTDARQAVAACDLSMICVGTPSAANGSLSLAALSRVAASLGEALPSARRGHVVVVRSTVLPGTTENVVVPLLEESSGLRCGEDFDVAVNPEFMREGSALADFDDPPKTIVGEREPRAGDRVVALYDGLPAPVFRVSLSVAETIKYADNAFHALKIAFANELGTLCKAFGVDSNDVIDVFVADRKLNISEAYLRPGFSFGGSCLPKDLRALLYAARHADLELPLLESILPSNERHLQRTLDLVLRLGRKRVAMLGLAFKAGIDDLRESPLVALAEALIGKGYEVRIYDPAVSISRLVGTNKEYIDEHLPHLSELLVETAEEAVVGAEVCVVSAAEPEAVSALAGAGGVHVIDLVRLPGDTQRRHEGGYVGVAW